MVVSVTTQLSLEFGNPVPVPRGGFMGSPAFAIINFDMLPDGEQFIAVFGSVSTAGVPTQINIVLNWFEELKRRVPTGNN